MKLDPFLPAIFNFPIADHHFQRGEYEEALAAARKINLPDFFWTQILLAGIYAELGRDSEARSAFEELLRLYPGSTTETLIKEVRKFNYPDDTIRRWVAALRKAGLPE
jgi:tetratricopeptide (TPR) repeat protein